MARSLIALIALAALAGCSAGGSGEVKLGVDVAPITALPGDTINTGSGDGAAGGATDAALEISRVRVLVNVAKIGYTGGDRSGSDSAEAGPFVVDLTADEIKNGARREFSLGELPSGTYGGAEIEIDQLSADADTSDEALADFVTSRASVLVDGSWQGKSFQFAGHFLAEQGTDGEVTVDTSTPVTLDMTVDPSTWFKDDAGAALDPTNTAQHDALAVAICETLDTQPQLGAPGASPQHAGRGGGGRGGNADHCVEQAR